jgi:pyridoxamine 5'-phosphate oxidase
MTEDLDAILDDIWNRWGCGAADRRSPFHTPVVGSIGLNKIPEQRIMVLRKATRPDGVLRFHTDIRSGKVAQIEHQPAVSVVGYDTGARIQLRATGSAVVVATGPLADAAWAATSPSGRRSYMTTWPPGSPSDLATSGLPVAFEKTMPSHAESEAGRANFSIVPVTVDRLEWLHLASSGHRRACFTRDDDQWRGEWLIP